MIADNDMTQTTNPPKYTHPTLLRLFKGTPYHTFANSYPQQIDQLRALVEKELLGFSSVRPLDVGFLVYVLIKAFRTKI